MATIKDVAKLAGVSVGTVSRVIAKNATVKQRYREKVNAAIQHLEFKPNFAAQALRTKQIDIIGLVVPDVANPFFANLAKNVAIEATKRKISVILANTNDDPNLENMQLHALLNHLPRGIIVSAVAPAHQLNIDTDVPIVSLDRRFMEYPLVATDHYHGSELVADHLFDLGHRRIGYVAGPASADVAMLRKDGFIAQIQKLSKNGEPVELLVREGSFDYASGEKIGHELLSLPESERPTAIACASDQLAIGVLRAARDFGIEIPGKLSIVGFDDVDLASLVMPRLTTIRQPVELLAKKAVELLFANGEVEPVTRLKGELINRNSTAFISR